MRKSDSSIFLTKDGEEGPEKSKINLSTIFLCLIGIGVGIIGTIAVMEAMKGNVTKNIYYHIHATIDRNFHYFFDH